jgi:hypothetical protein
MPRLCPREVYSDVLTLTKKGKASKAKMWHLAKHSMKKNKAG